MKNGIILAGGTGSRLFPLTHVLNKHLLGVNGKFIIDYPINTLQQMGIENLTVVMGGNHFSQVVDHLQDGRNYNLKCNYVYQGEAKGIAHAINLCQRYVNDDNEFVVILGDNIFEKPIIWQNVQAKAQIVLYQHPELHRFGVASLHRRTNEIVRIEEKPKTIDCNYHHLAITGCYRFDQRFFDFFSKIKPSARNEYEITDIIKAYHQVGDLNHTEIEGLWSDAGTHESIAFLNNYFYSQNKSVI